MATDIADRIATLTNRQQQVSALVCGGFSNKIIAHKLSLSEGTIKIHLHTIFEKLDFQSRIQLMIAMAG